MEGEAGGGRRVGVQEGVVLAAGQLPHLPPVPVALPVLQAESLPRMSQEGGGWVLPADLSVGSPGQGTSACSKKGKAREVQWMPGLLSLCFLITGRVFVGIGNLFLFVGNALDEIGEPTIIAVLAVIGGLCCGWAGLQFVLGVVKSCCRVFQIFD